MNRRRLRGRAGAVNQPIVTPPAPGATVVITASDFLIQRLIAAEPTTSIYNQDYFTTSGWSATDYQESAILKVLNWPAELTGKTITAVSLAIYRRQGYMDAGDSCTLSLRKVIRTWVYQEACWNLYSTGNSWTTAGGKDATDIDTGTAPSTIAVANSVGAQTFATSAAFVALVQGHKDGSITNNGYMLQPSTNFPDYHYWDGPTGAVPPVMTITYTA